RRYPRAATVPLPGELCCSAADGLRQPLAAAGRRRALGGLPLRLCRPARLARLRSQAVLLGRPCRSVAALRPLRRPPRFPPLAADRLCASGPAADLPVLPRLLP